MNDSFLSNFRESPRPEFARALYVRIDTPLKTTYAPGHRLALLMGWSSPAPRRQLALGIGLSALVLLLALALLPPARAYAAELVLRIGRLFITREPTYAEQFEAKINRAGPTGEPAASPSPLEWQAPPLLSLADASAQAAFPAAEISFQPSSLPMVARYVTLPGDEGLFTRVTTVYSDDQNNLVFSQTAYPPEAPTQTLPVGESPAAEVALQGGEGVWIENLRLSTYVDENNRVAPRFASLLVWEKDGFEYWLQATPGRPLPEMLAIAESIQP